MTKKKVVLGFLGTKLDAGTSDKRWERWRPTVALFGQDSFKPDQLELFITRAEQVELAQSISKDVARVNPQTCTNISTLAIEDPWNFQQVYAALHDFAKSYEFQDDCEYFVHLTTGTHVAQICLFLLTEARYFPARIVETYSHGGKSDLVNLWRGSVELIDLDLSSYDQLAKRFHKENLDSQDLLKGGIVTRNVAFNALIKRVGRVALKSSAPLLLNGPTGAGKSQMAARIYELRAKRHLVKGPFVEVNCATLRGDNAMSTLFGHKKGAFTGAASDRAGLLKSADSGILFLDEIGELGLDEQAMLLRALEDKRFTPMGSDKEIRSDFQLLAGTNQDLAQAVREGLFRADLLARINVWQFTLPGLADRIEDIEPNLEFELERAGQDQNTRISMTTEARQAYLAFANTAPWPGNFRDLASSVTRMATLAEAGRIGLADVQEECAHLVKTWACEWPDTANVSAFPDSNTCVKAILSEAQARAEDSFELAQLECVLKTISKTSSMAEAGRVLFSASRLSKDNPNDSDRVRKFLARWSLDYKDVKRKLTLLEQS